MSRLVLLAALVLSLAACGNRPGIRDEAVAVGTTLSAIQSQIARSRGTDRRDTSVITAGTPAQVRAVMATLQGDLNSVIVKKTNESSILLDAGTNHGYRRWVSPTGQTITLKSGMLTGTRGLGFDLMSVETDETLALVLHQREGNANKIYRFLDGEDQEVERPAKCTVSPRGNETITLHTGRSLRAMKMRETCLIGRLTVNNFFWVTGGRIVASEQWASDEIGVLRLQGLRGI